MLSACLIVRVLFDKIYLPILFQSMWNQQAYLTIVLLAPGCTMMRLIWRNKSGLLYIPVTTDRGALEAITVAVMRFRAFISSYL